MDLQEITVWDEKIRLFESDQNKEFLLHVADYLNNKMEDVKRNDTTCISTKILALRAAFTIAGEFLLMQREVSKLEFAIEKIEEQYASLRL